MILAKFNPFHWFPVWKAEEIQGPVPESPFKAEIDRALSLGFGIGAIVYMERLKDSPERFDSDNWFVICKLVEKGKISSYSKRLEIFKLISLKDTQYSTYSGTLYSIEEVCLISQAPVFKSIN